MGPKDLGPEDLETRKKRFGEGSFACHKAQGAVGFHSKSFLLYYYTIPLKGNVSDCMSVDLSGPFNGDGIWQFQLSRLQALGSL